MNESSTEFKNTKRATRWIMLILSVLAFGLMMGFRDELPLVWQRALAAAVAFAILVFRQISFSECRALVQLECVETFAAFGKTYLPWN